MPLFITYARRDKAAVDQLAGDLKRSRHAVWIDDELTGGQAWWDIILGQIRECSLYVFAVSSESIKSKACRLEFEYAQALGKRLLPVLIGNVHMSQLPPAISNAQIVDYRVRSVEASLALVAAVTSQPPARPLPTVLPQPPAAPISYMNQFQDQVTAPILTYQDQNHLLADLQPYLRSDDEDDRAAAAELIAQLRRRPDVVEGVARQIDQLFAGTGAPRPQSAPPRPTWSPPPTSYQSAPTSYQSPPTSYQAAPTSSAHAPVAHPVVQPAAAAPGPRPMGTGSFVASLMAAAFIPIAGLVIGLIMVANPARRGQAAGIIICSVIAFLIWAGLLSNTG